MPGYLTRLQGTDIRCLCRFDIEPDPDINLITGDNASGKTSLLEAIYVLGRGRSFRAAQRAHIVRDGADQFIVSGVVRGDEGDRRIGVQGGRGPLLARVDGVDARNRGELASVLPVEVIDPEVHKLIEEGPERRRRYLDWGTFHVEPRFLETWARYRRSLRQRNELLQGGKATDADLEPWEQAMAQAGEELTRMRMSFIEALARPLTLFSEALLDFPASVRFRSGWPDGTGLATELEKTRERDRQLGRTYSGPQRAELVIELAAHRARSRVSRGQQKLLAAALILAQLDVLSAVGKRRGVLLLDDPAAELDQDRVALLLAAVQQLDIQLFITALTSQNLPALPARRFHMEQYEPRLMV